MKVCTICGKEYEDTLTACPECGAVEKDSVSEITEDAIAENDPIPSEEDILTDCREKTASDEQENSIDVPQEAPLKKKKRRGRGAAVCGIVFPSLGLASGILTHAVIVIAVVLITVVLPYLLALTPIATPVTAVVTAIISVFACFFCFIGFLLSIIALVKKNKLGIAGLLMSIFFTLAIIAIEIISIATPYALQSMIKIIIN